MFDINAIIQCLLEIQSYTGMDMTGAILLFIMYSFQWLVIMHE